MDPNTTVEDILITVMEILEDEGNATEREVELAQDVYNLFGWIENGGFLPRSWRKGE